MFLPSDWPNSDWLVQILQWKGFVIYHEVVRLKFTEGVAVLCIYFTSSAVSRQRPAVRRRACASLSMPITKWELGSS